MLFIVFMHLCDSFSSDSLESFDSEPISDVTWYCCIHASSVVNHSLICCVLICFYVDVNLQHKYLFCNRENGSWPFKLWTRLLQTCPELNTGCKCSSVSLCLSVHPSVFVSLSLCLSVHLWPTIKAVVMRLDQSTVRKARDSKQEA